MKALKAATIFPHLFAIPQTVFNLKEETQSTPKTVLFGTALKSTVLQASHHFAR